MLKGLVIVVMCLTFTGDVSSQQKSGSRQQTISDELHPPSTSIDSHDTYNSTQQASATKTENEPPHWYTPLERPEWWLLGAAILTLVFIGRQTHFTRLAAEATKDAAKATLVQANHLVASERAWIMAEARFEEGGRVDIGGNDIQALRSEAIIELSLVNAGPTPAWVYEQWVQLKVSTEVFASRHEYSSPQFPFIGQEKNAHVNYGIHPITQGQSPVTWKAHIWDDGFPTEDNGLNIYIFGVVRYRDAFSSLRETYFGYRVVTGLNSLERIPNEAYNKYT